ncbi:hypothetical protein [Nonomuraea sp. NPDC049784]|uniref:alpha/beta hydrolase family protein n=1 Tax=Nonomuraea sp. NPDC049784 TaxID=3154361 RepID=UPI0033E4BEFE
MRPFEVVLSLAGLVASTVLAVPRLRGWRLAGCLLLLAPAAAVVQAAVEGPRWPLVPVYVLAGLLPLTWWVGRAVRPGRFVVVLGTLGGAVALAVSVALPVAAPVFRFRAPTGPYGIGTTTYHWVDASRPELFTADPGDHRELLAQVWYPAEKDVPGPHAPYIPDADAVTPVMAQLFRFPDFALTHFRYVTTHAVEGAPVARLPARYPVLVYLTGLNGFRAASTFQIEELVSHGYVVVGLDQPGAVAAVRLPSGRLIPGRPREEMQPLVTQSVTPQPTAPTLHGQALPNGIIPYFAQDVSFALDRLAGLDADDPHRLLTRRLDLHRAGVFGISLGGMNAAKACLEDARLKACLIMDVDLPADVVGKGLRQPTMLITRDAGTMRLERERAGGWPEEDIARTRRTMRAVYDGLPGDGYYLEIPGMFHLNFTDAPSWSPLTPQLGMCGPIGGGRGFDIVDAYSVAFFDRHLADRPSALLTGASKPYPEVTMATRTRS